VKGGKGTVLVFGGLVDDLEAMSISVPVALVFFFCFVSGIFEELASDSSKLERPIVL